MNKKEDISLEGVIEMHVHAGPDIRERKLDAWSLIDKARKANMRGIVLKNHYNPTALEAQILELKYDDIKVYGGLALNYSSGGLNPEAVSKSLEFGARIIWMPTHDAEHERKFYEKPGGIRILDDDKSRETLIEICHLIKSANAVLATGHLSYKEIIQVINLAKEVGVEHILINHPGIIFQRFSIDQQLEFIKLGAILEHSYARPPHTISWDDLADTLRATGTKSVILGTDLGQPQNPDPVEGMREMWFELLQRGFTKEELKVMTCDNPAAMLGLSKYSTSQKSNKKQ